MEMIPDAKKSRCVRCGGTPRFRTGDIDTDFIACDCRDPNGGFRHVLYGRWDLPKEWRLKWWYAWRFYTIVLLRKILKV
jgi:hypothetical protein